MARIPQTRLDQRVKEVVVEVPENGGNDRFVGAFAAFVSISLFRMVRTLALSEAELSGFSGENGVDEVRGGF